MQQKTQNSIASELASLVLYGALIWLAWTYGFPLLGRTLIYVFGPNEVQAHFLEQHKTQYLDFLEKTCTDISTCDKYQTVKHECAVAGNFDNCILVRMNGMDHSNCEILDGVKAENIGFLPTAQQCVLRDISHTFK